MMHTAAPRILIVRTDRIGDLVLSTPAIRAVRAAYPQGYLAALVQPATRALVDGHPALDEVLVLDKRGAHRGWRGFRRLVRELRARRFDQAFILHTTTRVVLATWWAGIPVRVGYARRLGWLLTHPAPYVKRFGAKHELDYTLDLVRLAGIPAPNPSPLTPPLSPKGRGRKGEGGMDRTLEIAWHPESRAPVEQWLASVGIGPSERLVLLHPGASCPSKRWPAARFAAVIDQLAGLPPHLSSPPMGERDTVRGPERALRFVAIAGPDDEALVRDVQRQARVPVLAPPRPFTLAELPWLLKRAQCLVSNDSGPVHLAGAAGTPVVAIFGRWGGGLSPTRWGPTGPRSVVVHHDVGCRPCLAHRCRIGFRCLDAVTVEEVVAAAKHILEGGHA